MALSLTLHDSFWLDSATLQRLPNEAILSNLYKLRRGESVRTQPQHTPRTHGDPVQAVSDDTTHDPPRAGPFNHTLYSSKDKSGQLDGVREGWVHGCMPMERCHMTPAACASRARGWRGGTGLPSILRAEDLPGAACSFSRLFWGNSATN